MKKIISLALVFVLIMTLTISVSAAETGSSIIIGNASTAGMYEAYKVLNAAVDVNNRGAITYSLNEDFLGFFLPGNAPDGVWLKTDPAVNAADSTIVTHGDATYYLHVTDANVANLAKALEDYIEGNGIGVDYRAGAGPAVDDEGNSLGNRAVFEGMEFGYYLIESPVGSVYMLASNNDWTLIEEKNTAPELTKQVAQHIDVSGYTEYTDSISAAANGSGAVFQYKVQVTVGAGATNYQLYDRYNYKLLTYQNHVVKYQASPTAEEITLTKDTHYLESHANFAGNDYEKLLYIKITDETLLVEGAIITLYMDVYAPEYLPTTGAVNKAYLVYGDNQSTPTATATVYSSEIEINKYADGDTSNVLEDAVFVLKNQEGKYAAIGTTSGPTGANARKYFDWISSKDNAEKFTTGEDGKVLISGVPNGTYYLEEITAPDGYNLLAEPVEVVVEPDDETVDPNGEELDPNRGVTIVKPVENKSGVELPSTGGMGTTLFYILGSLMAVGALVILVTNKRVRV